jgi:hypothetical protein
MKDEDKYRNICQRETYFVVSSYALSYEQFDPAPSYIASSDFLTVQLWFL